MAILSSLRVRLVGTVFLAVAAAVLCAWAWGALFARSEPGKLSENGTGLSYLWTSLAVGAVALVAVAVISERYFMRHIALISRAARSLAVGDLETRTGIANEKGELGELAETFDSIAGSLQKNAREREESERILLNRSFQQTVVSALGQFALTCSDFRTLLNQAVMLTSQTLELEYCGVFEFQPASRTLLLKAGVGWHEEAVGHVCIQADSQSQLGYALTAGEPVVVMNTQKDCRFVPSGFLASHGVLSGIAVVISGSGKPYGVLGAHTTNARTFTEDEVHFLLSVATVLAMAVEHDQTEVQLQKLAAFAQLNPNPAMELSAEGQITYFNDAALDLTFLAGHSHPNSLLPPNIQDLIQAAFLRKSSVRVQTVLSGRTLCWLLHPVPSQHAVHAYVEDATERLDLQAQLLQSQKMESVGQLAAGIAHDFNNMLTIIQGHAGLLLAKTGLPQQTADSVHAIYFGAERAASLTRQLLMFSRKNVIQPRLLDLQDVVTNLGKMLQRMLGESIKLEITGPTTPPMVKADVGMLEQVLMNLAVNARDAMPSGGILSIATFPVQIQPSYLETHPQARCGTFVCLRVKDTGCGMDEATRSRIYEPFFTTKEIGKGTGLGLATVYGIVKQHEGWIECESEPGQGTTFKIFLPASAELPVPVTAHADPDVVKGGTETILVVEDEPVLRQLAHTILTQSGYRILEAGNGVEAMKVWADHKNEIDLLLTDMVMPEGVSGMDLAYKLLEAKPSLKVIFASGYSMDNVDNKLVQDGRAVFVQKPYTHVTLTRIVRDCLDDPRQPAAASMTREPKMLVSNPPARPLPQRELQDAIS